MAKKVAKLGQSGQNWLPGGQIIAEIAQEKVITIQEVIYILF
jgi:hypothetical protein